MHSIALTISFIYTTHHPPHHTPLHTHHTHTHTHTHTGNYRSALNDSTQAKTVKPDHIKAIIRGYQLLTVTFCVILTFTLGALSCEQLSRFGEVIEWCDEGLKVDPENQRLREVRVKATKNKKQQDRDERKQSVKEKELKKQREKLLSTVKV